MTTITATYKLCARCQNWQRLDAFSIRRASPDGRQAYCKPCAIDAVLENRARKRARRNYKPNRAYLNGVEYEPIYTHPYGFTPEATRQAVRRSMR